MSRWLTFPVLVLLVLAGGTAAPVVAQDLQAIRLPPPQTDGGKPLMQVL